MKPHNRGVSRRVAVALPRWFFGGNPANFGVEAGLKMRRLYDNTWQMETTEQYRHEQARLMQSGIVATSEMDRLDELAVLPKGHLNPGTFPEIEKIARRLLAGLPEDLTTNLTAARALTAAVSDQQLPAEVGRLVSRLQSLRDPQQTPLFPDISVARVVPAPSLGYRLTLPRVLLRSEVAAERPSQVPSQINRSFRSASDLLLGTQVFDLYLAPLLLSHSPLVWAVSSIRGNQIILYCLGRLVPGERGNPVEPLQIFLSASDRPTSVEPSLGSPHSDTTYAAINWWTERLNDLFAVISDVALFRDAQDRYDPTWHLHTMLTVEQLFRHLESLLAQTRSAHTQRVLFFGFFDT